MRRNQIIINYFIRPRRGTRGVPNLSPTDIRRDIMKRQRQSSVMETVATHPWDRRDDESAKQYQAFCIYRDMGPDRGKVAVARELQIAPSSSQTWARMFQWDQRVRAYDEWDEKRQRRVAERARKEMVERQARLGQTMTEIAHKHLVGGDGAVQIVPETVADVVRLAEAGTKIERLARGESTENVATAMRLVLAHPLPPWAPKQAHQLVEESVYDDTGTGTIENQSPAGLTIGASYDGSGVGKR